MIEEVNKPEVLLQMIDQQDISLIYFYNNDCAPCISLRPKMENLISQEYDDIDLYFMEGNRHAEFLAELSILSFPTIIIYVAGKEAKRYSKYISLSEIATDIDRYSSLLSS